MCAAIRSSESTVDGFASTPTPARDRILVVDDDPGTVSGYATILRAAGYTVATADSARECAKRIHREYFSLVILDLYLYGKSCVSLLRRLRQAGIRTPVVIVTGLGDISAAVATMKLGAADFVLKPVFSDELIKLVSQHARHCPKAISLYRIHTRHDILGPIVKEIETATKRTLDVGKGDGPLPHAVPLRALAQACCTPGVQAEEFASLAEAFRRCIVANGDSITSHLLIEIEDALRQITTNGDVDLRVRTILSAMSQGDVGILRRNEKTWGQVLGVDPSHLGRLLCTHTGRRFREWRTLHRIKKAVFLLAVDNEHVAQIAYVVGFSDPSHFSRDFRTCLGLSPLEFRRIVRGS